MADVSSAQKVSPNPQKTTYADPFDTKNAHPLSEELQKRVISKTTVRKIVYCPLRTRLTSSESESGTENKSEGCGSPTRKISPSKFIRFDDVPGRVMEVYESEKSGLRVVQIYHNGDECNLPRKIILNKAMMNDMEQILNFIQDKMPSVRAALDGLYTLQGRKLVDPIEIESFGTYVAVERGRKFKNVFYRDSDMYVQGKFKKEPTSPVDTQPKPRKISTRLGRREGADEVDAEEQEQNEEKLRTVRIYLVLTRTYRGP